MMRICVITDRFYPFIGGAEIRQLEILKRIARKNDVHVYTAWGDVTQNIMTWKNIQKTENIEGINIHRLNKVKPSKFRIGTRSPYVCFEYALSVINELRQTEKFDLYEFNHFPLLHIPFIKPFIAGKVTILWHEIWGDIWRKYRNLGKFGKEMEYFVSKLKWDKHITVSKFTANRLHNFYNISKQNIAIIPFGARDDFYGQSKKVEGKIVFAGRLTPDKHAHDLLLDSYSEAKKHDPSLNLHIIGDGPCRSLIKYKAKKMEDVYVYPYLPYNNFVKHIKSSWLLCLPSEYEGQGILALEAQASGTPVITTNYPLNAVAHEFVINDYNGYVVEPTANAISRAIKKITFNWHRLSKNSVKYAKKYSLEMAAKKTEKLYENLMK